LGKEISEIEVLLTPLMKGRVEVNIDVPTDIGFVWADPTAVQQILMNLSINSFDAMPNGGTLTISVRVATESPGKQLAPSGFLELAVTDTGTGMDEATRQRLFEPFFTTKEPGKGSGLGLSTVHGLVEQCGGAISVESAPQRGATFRVLLPRVAEKVAPSPASAAVGGVVRILLVEDDPMVRHLLTQLLMSGGYHVSAHGVPEEALALLEQGADIGLVITDVLMPGLTGPELMRRAEAVRGPIRTLFISGHNTDPMFRSGNLPTWCRFLRKPFPPMELLKEVKLTLERPLG
jgi:CheY-like chemotaxis protein